MDDLRIGLALGSGGMRGFAHIGILQALQCENIPVHLVSGCSIGSVIAAVTACGIDPFMLEKIAVLLNERDLLDFTLPRMGLVRGNKISSIVMTLTQNRNIDQTDIPLIIIACDLAGCRLHEYTQGKIHEAVRASCSIPGIFEPVMQDGRLMVDGGTMQRVPVRQLREHGADVVIGVDVGYRGQVQRVPKDVKEILLQTFDVMGWETSRLSERLDPADVLIIPDIMHISSLRYHHVEECIALGRQAAVEKMPQIKAAIEKARESLTR